MHTDASPPNAKDLTPAALRHRLRVELRASASDVWALIGPHVRLPEYSAGIVSVEVEGNADGSRTRVCQFRSPDGSGPGPRLRERIYWEAPTLGYATMAEPGNVFGLEHCLELLTLAPVPAGTLLTWEEYYDSPDLAAARASFDEGLADIGRRLVERFGGLMLERYTDAPL